MSTRPPTPSPAEAWHDLQLGNERFIDGTPLHPRQDAEHRATLAGGQSPRAAILGCSDSRLAAEIIFDAGLGDLFVVRNAGQVASESAVGSLEYAVGVLEVPLIVVLAHDACGAVLAAVASGRPDSRPLPPNIARLIARIAPAIARVTATSAAEGGDVAAEPDLREVGRQHLRDTIGALLESSELISDAVAAGTLAVVGANYRLSEGRVVPDIHIGAL